MPDLIPFQYESQQVRVIRDDFGEPWFVAKDVCDVLGLVNSRKAVSTFDDDEKSTVTISDGTSPKGGNPNMTIVSEPGLYNLIFQSRKPEAKKFKRWITHEVIPSIRKTGRYEMPHRLESQDHEDKIMARAIAVAYRDLAKDRLIPEHYRSVCRVKAIEALTGEPHSFLIPVVHNGRDHWITMSQAAETLEVSPQLAGRRAKKLGLHGENDPNHEWSESFWDKSRSSAKEVISYRYDPDVILPALRKEIHGQVQ